MSVKIQTKIGEHQIVVERETLMDCFPVAAFMGEILRAAGKRRVVLTFRQPKGFTYYGLMDLDTGEEMNFGQAKSGGLYVKEDWKPGYGASRSGYDQGDAPPPEDQDPEPPPPRSHPDQSAGRPPVQPAAPARTTRF